MRLENETWLKWDIIRAKGNRKRKPVLQNTVKGVKRLGEIYSRQKDRPEVTVPKWYRDHREMGGKRSRSDAERNGRLKNRELHNATIKYN